MTLSNVEGHFSYFKYFYKYLVKKYAYILAEDIAIAKLLV